jgi:hypothetical protein
VDASLVTFVSCFLLGLAASPFISNKKRTRAKKLLCNVLTR